MCVCAFSTRGCSMGIWRHSTMPWMACRNFKSDFSAAAVGVRFINGSMWRTLGTLPKNLPSSPIKCSPDGRVKISIKSCLSRISDIFCKGLKNQLLNRRPPPLDFVLFTNPMQRVKNDFAVYRTKDWKAILPIWRMSIGMVFKRKYFKSFQCCRIHNHKAWTKEILKIYINRRSITMNTSQFLIFDQPLQFPKNVWTMHQRTLSIQV